MKEGVMKFSRALMYTVLLLSVVCHGGSARAQPAPQPPTGGAVPVTVDNFIRAESDKALASTVKLGGFGKFNHSRELAALDRQIVARENRDTLYSLAVPDFDAGPVTVTLPDAGGRFMSMIVIDEDHYVVDVVYRPGTYTFTKDKIGTRYALIAIRLLVDPADPKDLQQVHALQDALKIEQPGGPGRFEIPNWDPPSQKKVHDPLVALGETLPDWRNAAGRRGEVDPVRHLIVTATGWGLNPDKDAIYLNVTPSKNDGATIYKLAVKDVPVDGFWSISVYNGEGYFVPNKFNAYTLNNITAKKSSDGAIAIQFGGCDGQIANCLPTMSGWNYIVRLYRPRAEILNGAWKFPEAQPAN
jgi:hypothetical protein